MIILIFLSIYVFLSILSNYVQIYLSIIIPVRLLDEKSNDFRFDDTIYLSIHQFIYFYSTYISISIYLSIIIPVRLLDERSNDTIQVSIYLCISVYSIYLCTLYISIYLSKILSISTYIYLYLYLSISISISIYIYIYLYLYLSISISIYLYIYLLDR